MIEQEKGKKPSTTVTPDSRIVAVSSLAPKISSGNSLNKAMGIGMFIPELANLKPMYFYGDVNFDKSIQEHFPIDSLTFMRKENGGYEIATAPPWLAPDHMKLDYDLLYFRVVTVTDDFLEVVVNTKTLQTRLIDKRAGLLKYWPDFLLGVHSVGLLPEANQAVHSRPFRESGIITSEFSFMKPIKIKNSWMYVELWNDDYTKSGNGWIQWQKDGKLMISYSLLS